MKSARSAINRVNHCHQRFNRKKETDKEHMCPHTTEIGIGQQKKLRGNQDD